MVLDDICTSEVYSSNPFYLLGLTVDTTSRKIRRRQEDVVDGLSVLGEKAWNAEFDKYLLGNSPSPSVEVAKSLIDRLKNDPEYFATEMFFWFWPQGESADSAIEAIARGDRAIAVCAWRADVNKSGKRGIVARHNLALILHFYAIDGELQIRTSSKNVDSAYFKAVDRFWKDSFSFWEDLVDDDAFWDVYAERVALLKDPRLDAEFIDSFRERFPICFDNINADFMVAYAKAGKLNDAKRQFEYMTATMSGIDDIEETMERAFKPLADKVRVLIKQCENTKDPKKVLSACRDLFAGTKDLAAIFKKILPEGNSYTRKVINEVIATVENKLPSYSRETGDYEPCLKLTQELLAIASTPMMKEKLQKSIEEWEDLVRQVREENTCCVCGNYRKDMPEMPLKLYRDVMADPTMFGRVQWRTKTIQIPVCKNCRGKFSPSSAIVAHAKKLAIVQQLIADGWKIGEKPSQSEMDAVRFL